MLLDIVVHGLAHPL